MKMVKILDAKGMALVSDALNQMILQKLAARPNSVTGLSRELNIPALKVWRRIQRLMKAKLVNVSRIEKVGNLEKKLYRATALRYDVSPQFFGPKLNDLNVQAAFELYIKVQNEEMAYLSSFDNDIPEEEDPTDFAVYALMQAFVQMFEKETTQARVGEIKQLLSNYENKKSLPPPYM